MLFKSRLSCDSWARIGKFRTRQLFLLIVLIAFVGSAMLAVTRAVPLKLLPFDNKNELQMMIDMPRGSTLETTDEVARAIGSYLPPSMKSPIIKPISVWHHRWILTAWSAITICGTADILAKSVSTCCPRTSGNSSHMKSPYAFGPK